MYKKKRTEIKNVQNEYSMLIHQYEQDISASLFVVDSYTKTWIISISTDRSGVTGTQIAGQDLYQP